MARRRFETKKRGQSNRRIKPVFLIITEGRNKTETLYLSHFQGQEKNYSLKFVKAGSNTDAESLYKTITKKWKEYELSEKNGDKGFIVIDIDNDPGKEEKLKELLKSNKNSSIVFVVSNPAFEVWLLLHFVYTTKYYTDGNTVINDLKKYIPDYEKNKDCYNVCLTLISEALENADKLNAHFGEERWPSVKCNPRTDMGELIKLLLYEG